MTTHNEARQIVRGMIEADIGFAPELVALIRYIDGIEAGERAPTATVSQVAHGADRRSHEAVARSITNAEDIVDLQPKIAAIFGALDEIVALIPSSEVDLTTS